MNKSIVCLACLLSLSVITAVANDHESREHGLALTDASTDESKHSQEDQSDHISPDGSVKDHDDDGGVIDDDDGDVQSRSFILKKMSKSALKKQHKRHGKENMMMKEGKKMKEKMKCSMMAKKKAELDERFQYVWKAIMTMGEDIKRLQGPNTDSHLQLDCPPESLNETKCKMDEDSQLCSGHGSCSCGVCICDPKHHGMYCECEPCEYQNGVQCGGQERGQCQCGKCACRSQYAGNNCECDTSNTDTSACQDPDLKRLICSGNGDCVCNTCHCQEGYYGNRCQESVAPNYDCDQLKMCVLCQVFYEEEQGCSLCDLEITMVDELIVAGNQYRCKVGGQNKNCFLNFAYSLPDDNFSRMEVEVEKMKCPLNFS